LLPSLPETTLLAQAFEAKLISNIIITVRINYLSYSLYFSQTIQNRIISQMEDILFLFRFNGFV
jgi:hypothetical protein